MSIMEYLLNILLLYLEFLVTYHVNKKYNLNLFDKWSDWVGK